jgi:hypothetical protein
MTAKNQEAVPQTNRLFTVFLRGNSTDTYVLTNAKRLSSNRL